MHVYSNWDFQPNISLTSPLGQDFELEVTGAHIIKVNICSKQLLKEECYAHGKIRVSHVVSEFVEYQLVFHWGGRNWLASCLYRLGTPLSVN